MSFRGLASVFSRSIKKIFSRFRLFFPPLSDNGQQQQQRLLRQQQQRQQRLEAAAAAAAVKSYALKKKKVLDSWKKRQRAKTEDKGSSLSFSFPPKIGNTRNQKKINTGERTSSVAVGTCNCEGDFFFHFPSNK